MLSHDLHTSVITVCKIFHGSMNVSSDEHFEVRFQIRSTASKSVNRPSISPEEIIRAGYSGHLTMMRMREVDPYIVVLIRGCYCLGKQILETRCCCLVNGSTTQTTNGIGLLCLFQLRSTDSDDDWQVVEFLHHQSYNFGRSCQFED